MLVQYWLASPPLEPFFYLVCLLKLLHGLPQLLLHASSCLMCCLSILLCFSKLQLKAAHSLPEAWQLCQPHS